jgi:outer membrane biosynthesis protein TonB
MDAEQIVRDVAEKVRDLITQAEERAAQIVRDAEDEATRIRARAEADARKQLDEVKAAFEELQGRFGAAAPSAEVEPGPVVVPEPEPPPVPEPQPPPVPEPAPEPSPPPAPERVPEPTPPPDEGTPPTAANGKKSHDAAGARLVAMNMALDGASRGDIEAKLAAEYELDDAGSIVDDVLALSGK